MITRLRLKNWRSLRDVTIDDLQPINVFIGANASGKTNILDALYFTREMFTRDIIQAVYKRGGGEKIRSLGVGPDQAAEIEFTCQLTGYEKPITWGMRLWFPEQDYRFWIERILRENNRILLGDPNRLIADVATPRLYYAGNSELRGENESRLLLDILTGYIVFRWQMLEENFKPPLNVSSSEIGNTFLIDPNARNLVFMLDYMLKTRPELFTNLQSDLQYSLGYINQIQSQRDERETRVSVRETTFPSTEAPTVSVGTARIMAMVAAYYALDMQNSEQSGLVIIEEPDTALNPGLLKNFVEQLREYVDRPEPRQFILTTHNPAFLNYFRPEEVRIVARDEQGYTTVNRVPDYIKDIWLDEHGLGEVWLTNAFGGVAE